MNEIDFLSAKQVVDAPQGQNAAEIAKASDKLQAVQVQFEKPNGGEEMDRRGR